jgi:hypothetical protein
MRPISGCCASRWVINRDLLRCPQVAVDVHELTRL